MAKLKLGRIEDDKPVRLSIELTAAIHRDLLAYAEALSRETGQGADSDGSRPAFRDDLAHHSDLMSLGVPR